MLLAIPLINLAFGPITGMLLTPGQDGPIGDVCKYTDKLYKTGEFCFNMTVELGIGYWLTVLTVGLSIFSGFDGAPTYKYLHHGLFPMDHPPPNFFGCPY